MKQSAIKTLLRLNTDKFQRYIKPPKILFQSMAINKENYYIRLDIEP